MIGNILRQRYQIVKELGAGGFGETYLAEDLDIPVTPKPICVVKRLKPTEIDRDTIRLFEQEAQILYQLGQNYDQMPKLYAYFQENQEFYLIQELIDGYDLTQEISPGKKLSESEVIKLLQDVLEILVYVHGNKVIHRDIKPANIMRRKDGKLVLIDFGAIKQINTTIAMKSGSTTRTIRIGTPGYTPLEQAMGKPKFSSDIYALGMTAIQALIDLSPRLLPEDDDGEILWSDQVKVSNKLGNFITKMVRCDWRQRYRNAKEALDELNQIFGVGKPQNIHPARLTELSELCIQKGHKLFNLQRYENAIESYDKAIAIKPYKYEAWYNRGLALAELEKYEEAIASYDKAIAIKPDYHEALYRQGVALRQLHRYTEAIASYDKAIAIKPDDHQAWNNRGIALDELQRYAEAIVSYNKAIAIKPDYYITWNNRGIALRQLREYTKAIASYDRAITIKPDYHQAWNNRGLALSNLQKYEEAVASYDRAIAIKPDHHEAWNNRGLALGNLRRYEEALKSHEKAISIRPDFKIAINNRHDLLKQFNRSN
ncbi:tetratricopeptide repeat protein [Anabaena sp. WFMT]|uniref:tetratricopeptide repeat protein n=1 Tax=Anabaena sp. WFMT TaxID=3449730 RepID=UPI003F203BC6